MSEAKTWIPQDAKLRWLVPATTSTEAPRLQQVWVCYETGEREWRDVPRVVEGEDAPLTRTMRLSRGVSEG
jgi:hypothetical protein